MDKQIQTPARAAMAAFEARPENCGPMRDASAHARITGPCGDTVEVWLRIDGGKIRKGTFMSDGCGHSRHCCSAAVKLTEGLRPDEAARISPDQVLEAAGPVPPDHQHCALLAANAIKAALGPWLARPAETGLAQKVRRWIRR